MLLFVRPKREMTSDSWPMMSLFFRGVFRIFRPKIDRSKFYFGKCLYFEFCLGLIRLIFCAIGRPAVVMSFVFVSYLSP